MIKTFDYEVYKDNPEKIRQLWDAAHIDQLTKLYNRYGMEEWITEQLEMQKDDEKSALLIIDVDNFKNINDTYGHMLGDALLIEIADCIRRLFSEEYFCGRIGGDEYQIFACHVTSPDKVQALSEALCSQVKKCCRQGNQVYDVSLSIGIAFAEGSRKNYGELYTQADLALYHAKEMGKDCYFVYNENTPITQTKRIDKRIEKNRSTEQIGESGFSLSKILLNEVYHILDKIDDPKTAIEQITKAIVETFDVTRAYGSCYTENEMQIGASYYYAQNDDPNIRPNILFSGREYEKRFFNKDSIFFCTDVEQTMEPMRSELKRMHVQTMLQVLIHKDGKIIGTLGINNCGYKRLWLQSEVEVIHTIAMLMREHIYRLQQEGK